MASLTVLADLDGTLLPPPDAQTKSTPPLSQGPALAPLLSLLELGAKVIGITGSKLSTHRRLFFDVLPSEARRKGLVLMAVETGRRLYRGDSSSGDAVEDSVFSAFVDTQLPNFDDATVAELTAIGRAGIVQFYEDFARDPGMVARDGPHAVLHNYAGSSDAKDPPVTTQKEHYPRVEVREANGAVVFYGVPASLGTRYFVVPDELSSIVDGHPAGHNCFDCIPRGLSKALVVDHLLHTGEVAPGAAVALGDSPVGNDEGLTRWHGRGIPFISVCPGAVPSELADCHVTARSHADASAEVLSMLAETCAQAPITREAVACLVASINGS